MNEETEKTVWLASVVAGWEKADPSEVMLDERPKRDRFVYPGFNRPGVFTVEWTEIPARPGSVLASYRRWSPLTSLSDAWKVVMAITAVPKTGEEAERMWNTQFAVRFGRLALWAMDEAEAANAICQLALQISGYYDNRG